MLITWRPILACRLCLATVVLGGGFVSPAHAADGERGISIYLFDFSSAGRPKIRKKMTQAIVAQGA
jgi:hypothetical protein